MRTARIKEEGAGYYHIISRIVDRRRVMDGQEKERFRLLMRSVESFSGCQILTYALLDNHFHVLLYVPQRQELSDEALLCRLGCLYDRRRVRTVAQQLARFRKQEQSQAAESLRAQYTCRMYDLSQFVKTLKQRYTQSYNRRRRRKGTLWEERFKSLLVGGNAFALSAVAAYIDLNPVRAGLAADPKDYRFCGYGEAMGGSALARLGLCRILLSLDQCGGWDAAAAEYRGLLYSVGEARGSSETGAPLRAGFSAERVKAVLESGGRLPLNEILRCRVRYFTDGAILGSRAFLEEALQRHRARFGARRMSLARPMTGADWGDLCTARRLRLAAITVAMRT